MFNILLVQIAELYFFKYKNSTNKPLKQAEDHLAKTKVEKFPSQKCNFQETLGMNYKQDIKMGTHLYLILQCLHPSALGTLAESKNVED